MLFSVLNSATSLSMKFQCVIQSIRGYEIHDIAFLVFLVILEATIKLGPFKIEVTLHRLVSEWHLLAPKL